MAYTVRHPEPNNVFVWRVPRESLVSDNILCVREYEEAIEVRNGGIIRSFPGGEHKLDQETAELLHSNVYFINKGMLATIVWGTGVPVMFRDAVYKKEIPVRLDGELNFRVSDSAVLFTRFQNDFEDFDQNMFNKQIRTAVMIDLRQYLDGQMERNTRSLLEIQWFFSEIAPGLRRSIAQKLDTYGLEMAGFCINQILVPENDPSYIQIKKAAEAEKAIETAPKKIICPECGAALSEENLFCGYCGYKIKNCCAGCGSVLSRKAKFCEKCGRKIDWQTP